MQRKPKSMVLQKKRLRDINPNYELGAWSLELGSNCAFNSAKERTKESPTSTSPCSQCSVPSAQCSNFNTSDFLSKLKYPHIPTNYVTTTSKFEVCKGLNFKIHSNYQAAALAASLLNHKKRSSGYRQKLIQSKVHSLENMSKKFGTLLDCAMQEENHGILQLIIYTPPLCYGKNNPKTQDLLPAIFSNKFKTLIRTTLSLLRSLDTIKSALMRRSCFLPLHWH